MLELEVLEVLYWLSAFAAAHYQLLAALVLAPATIQALCGNPLQFLA